MAIQVQGASGVTSEVETNTRATRVAIRPGDVGALGAYSIGAASGVMAAGLAAGSPIFSFRYGGTGIVLIRRVLFSAANAGTAFATGIGNFSLFAARSFTASDTGGTAITPTLNKLRTSMATTGVSSISIATTGALTAGTRTLDGQPLALTSGPAAAASAVIVPAQTPLLDRSAPSAWPDVIAQNEGFVIAATVPATGTWAFAVQVDWEEVSTFGTGLAA